MHVIIGCDHAGFQLKSFLIEHLNEAGHTVEDVGTNGTDSVDYPDFGQKVAEAVAGQSEKLGILVCGTGIGMAMSANKVPGVRAAVCSETFSARATRAHNDANVICIGERVVGIGVAAEIIDAFLETPFEGGRHERRVGKINALDAC